MASEIDIIIGQHIYRTVTRGALDHLTYPSLHEIVLRKVQHWGQLPTADLAHFRIQYLKKDNTLCEMSHSFPADTDLGWREFYAGVFYVDFPEAEYTSCQTLHRKSL
jgi:hypothetical protein